MPEVTLASNITTTTNGPSAGVQPYGSTEPIVCDIFGKVIGTSGTIAATVQVQGSSDNSSWTTIATLTFSAASTSQPFAIQQKVAYPLLRVNVSAISGTGASVYCNARIP